MGAYGIGIVSQIINFTNLLGFIGTIGLPLGLIKYFSEREKNNEWKKINSILNITLIYLFVLGTLISTIIIFLSDFVSETILDTGNHKILIILASISLPFNFCVAIFDAYLKGIKKFGKLVSISVSISILSIVITGIFVYLYGLTGAVIALLSTSVLSFIYYIIFMVRFGLYKFDFSLKLPLTKEIKLIFAVGLATLIVGSAENFSLLLIRSTVIKVMGAMYNGIYQCVYSISNNYIGLFYITISTYAFPILSAIKEEDKMNSEINSLLRFTILFIAPIIAIAFVFKEILIVIFFSNNFLEAKDLLLFNFIGDFFKALTWVFGAWFVPASRIKLWVVIAIIYHIMYFTIFYIIIQNNLGLYSIVYSYLISNFIVCVISFYCIVKLNNFKMEKNNISTLNYSILFLTLILLISSLNVYWGYFLLFPLLIIWSILVVEIQEIRNFKDLIINKFKLSNNDH